MRTIRQNETTLKRVETRGIYRKKTVIQRGFTHVYYLVKKDMVFNIEMDNYAGLKEYEYGAFCEPCWIFIQYAKDILKTVLRQEFPDHKLLNVFSR
jgi:DNA primase catalytic subunit